MKKRNVLTLLLALVLVAAIAVGSTLAYFTSQDDTSNTFTMGKVEINLDESDDEGVTWEEDGLEYSAVLPGNVENKIARVTVDEDSEDCYLMMTVEVAVAEDTTLTSADIAALYGAIVDAIDDEAWTVTTENDGTLKCVYNGSLTAEEEVRLFETITIPTSFGNNTAGQSFEIVLNAYAIQADNLELSDVDWDAEFAAE